MKMQRYLLYIASLAVCALLVLSACGGPTPIAGGVTETVTPASPTTGVPSTEPPKSTGSPTADVSPSPVATATEVLPTPSGTPPSTETPTPPATDTPTPTETPTPVVEIKAGAFTLRQVSIENNSAISNTIAPYVSFDGKFGAPYAGFEGSHGPELFTGRVFQDEKGTIFVLPSGGDVSQQLAWLGKYSNNGNINLPSNNPNHITSNEFIGLGKGKVVIVGTGAVFVYPDGNYRTISAPRIVTDHSSQSTSNQQMEKFEGKYPKIWWSEVWGTVVASDDNDMVISHIYNQGTNSWVRASLVDPKNQLKTPEQILTEWRQRIEVPGNIAEYTSEEKAKLLEYFDALKYVTPRKDEQIKKIFPWFHAPVSADFPLRFLEYVKIVKNNVGNGISAGVAYPEVKLDIVFNKTKLPGESTSDFVKRTKLNEAQWWIQVAGLMKEAMTNTWMIHYRDNYDKDPYYADIAPMGIWITVLQDFLNARKPDGSYVISNRATRKEIEDNNAAYIRQIKIDAINRGWNHNYP